ncbi:hypothetical protein PRIPAC_84986 [Pristionchus pacificus]|uniref:Uncharacterized protein n=1 Tax=Pristionchus pacificus TaxID=54126 RepID=A0A2A6BU12_PRIPA|nr:hypothetical protein PRIPAC_84986 [Pristionchus pacificus]|eukprot:PDM69472.1 hypothetical protein PRIPAC_44568 [Pristionchus pacificus]
MSEDGKALKSDRRKCYQVRDSYFSCTDTLLDSGKTEKEAEKACRVEWKAFEANCPSSWVGHFVRKHNFERRATSSRVSRPAAAATPHRSKKSAATAAGSSSAELQRQQQLQQLWELSKGMKEMEPFSKKAMKKLEDGEGAMNVSHLPLIVKNMSSSNDFAALSRILGGLLKEEKVRNVRVVNEVIWAAVLAKSLGVLPPSILVWIEDTVRHLGEPIPAMKESMIWLLSILRGDLQQLQQLQQDSCSKRGVVGPELEREKTLRHLALSYLAAGQGDEFRQVCSELPCCFAVSLTLQSGAKLSLWTSSKTPLMEEDEHLGHQHTAALLHHALLRSAGSRKPDDSMLRWYAESLVAHQRTPIPENPHWQTMMTPVVSAFGGKIEKWKEGDVRVKKLRKWRDEYDDSELDKLVVSMLDHMKSLISNEYGSSEDLRRLEKMLARVKRKDGGHGRTVVVDWLNLRGVNDEDMKMDSFLPSHSLIVVGREKSGAADCTIHPPKESKRIKVMKVTKKTQRKQEVDDICSMVLAVATRGHLLSNDKTRPHVSYFREYLRDESRDVSQSILLQNYLNDAVVRHNGCQMIQPVVEYSRAAQWIDENKKELAFTVGRKPKDEDSPFRVIDHYSLHI